MSVTPPYVLAAPPSAAPANRPSWAAWTALALSAASFLVATTVGIVYAVDTLSDQGSDSALDDGSEEGLLYDAGMPVWGTVQLAPSGAATERTLTDSLEEALRSGIQDFDGAAEDIGDVYCAALAAPRKDSVGTCSATVQEIEMTVVLVFTDNTGGYLATVY